MVLSNFFRDDEGNIAVFQWPNWPIWVIIAATLVNRLITQADIIIKPLISFMLFYWGFLEITQGLSGFRKALGAVAIGYSVLRLVE